MSLPLTKACIHSSLVEAVARLLQIPVQVHVASQNNTPQWYQDMWAASFNGLPGRQGRAKYPGVLWVPPGGEGAGTPGGRPQFAADSQSIVQGLARGGWADASGRGRGGGGGGLTVQADVLLQEMLTVAPIPAFLELCHGVGAGAPTPAPKADAKTDAKTDAKAAGFCQQLHAASIQLLKTHPTAAPGGDGGGAGAGAGAGEADGTAAAAAAAAAARSATAEGNVPGRAGAGTAYVRWAAGRAAFNERFLQPLDTALANADGREPFTFLSGGSFPCVADVYCYTFVQRHCMYVDHPVEKER